MDGREVTALHSRAATAGCAQCSVLHKSWHCTEALCSEVLLLPLFFGGCLKLSLQLTKPENAEFKMEKHTSRLKDRDLFVEGGKIYASPLHQYRHRLSTTSVLEVSNSLPLLHILLLYKCLTTSFLLITTTKSFSAF